MKPFIVNHNSIDENDYIKFRLIPTIGFGYEKNYYIAISLSFLQYELICVKYKTLSP
jgi:hypothetical protein